MSPGWVEARLGISRTTRLDWEKRGLLHPIRLTGTSHRRYQRSDVEALIAGNQDPTSFAHGDVDAAAVSPSTVAATPSGTPEAPPSAPAPKAGTPDGGAA